MGSSPRNINGKSCGLYWTYVSLQTLWAWHELPAHNWLCYGIHIIIKPIVSTKFKSFRTLENRFVSKSLLVFFLPFGLVWPIPVAMLNFVTCSLFYFCTSSSIRLHGHSAIILTAHCYHQNFDLMMFPNFQYNFQVSLFNQVKKRDICENSCEWTDCLRRLTVCLKASELSQKIA